MYSDGRLALNFEWLRDNKQTENYRDEFKEGLTKLGIQIPADYTVRRPGVPIDSWYHVAKDFIAIVRKMMNDGR